MVDSLNRSRIILSDKQFISYELPIFIGRNSIQLFEQAGEIADVLVTHLICHFGNYQVTLF